MIKEKSRMIKVKFDTIKEKSRMIKEKSNMIRYNFRMIKEKGLKRENSIWWNKNPEW